VREREGQGLRWLGAAALGWFVNNLEPFFST
jgi:hypothetical protein